MPCPSRILTLHPDPLVNAGIVSSLRQHAAFDVFAEDPDAVGLDERPIAVVIGDYQQAMRIAAPAARAARRSLATARVLVLTSNDRETDIRRAIEAGVHGYLLLGGPLSELVEAVTALAHGGRYLGRSVAQRMADSLSRTSLTSREVEVLELVAAGECNKAIARRLHIEVGTVKSHMNAILGKLDATSRTQAAAIAVTRGLVEERMRIPANAFSPRVSRAEPMTQAA
ncbi:response regulator transcription factor [Piscinibacter sp.]|uniref:response regulator transcription factor n=1 Tax=Piscinibacter sp. TaxID=1903157 RepID=UPI002ED3026A